MVARVAGVDGDDGQMGEVLALVRAERFAGGDLGLLQHILREDMRNAMLVDGDQAEGARRQRIAQHHRHPHPRARRFADRLSEDQLAFLGTAQIGDGVEWRSRLSMGASQPLPAPSISTTPMVWSA
jgi:hypothetical protein